MLYHRIMRALVPLPSYCSTFVSLKEKRTPEDLINVIVNQSVPCITLISNVEHDEHSLYWPEIMDFDFLHKFFKLCHKNELLGCVRKSHLASHRMYVRIYPKRKAHD